MYERTRFFGFPVFLGVAVLTAMTLSGCAGTGGSASDLPKRIDLDGHSFQPPDEPRWFIANQSIDQVALAKPGRMDGESFTIESTRFPLQDISGPQQLVRFVREWQARDMPRPRFRIYQHDVSEAIIGDAQCAVSQVVTEDREPETGTNVVTSMLIETVGAVCINPAQPDSGVILNYTHRSFPEDRDRGFSDLALRTIQTLQFKKQGHE